MDDRYAINVAKTEYREAYNTGDVDRLIAITDPEIVDFSDGRRLALFDGARDAMREYFAKLFAEYRVHLNVIEIEIRIQGNVAYDYGWHNWTLTPRAGGELKHVCERYVDIWKKNAAGEWKLWMLMTNRDVPDPMFASAAA